jgi:hypothetical protein
MNYICAIRAVSAALALVAVSGCHRQASPVGELEKTVAAMEKTAPAAAPDGNSAAPATELKAAIEEYKSGKMEEAVTRLQILRMQPTMTPEQRMSLQDSVAAVMTEVYELAQKGDPKAIAAVQAYERMQTRH